MRWIIASVIVIGIVVFSSGISYGECKCYRDCRNSAVSDGVSCAKLSERLQEDCYRRQRESYEACAKSCSTAATCQMKITGEKCGGWCNSLNCGDCCLAPECTYCPSGCCKTTSNTTVYYSKTNTCGAGGTEIPRAIKEQAVGGEIKATFHFIVKQGSACPMIDRFEHGSVSEYSCACGTSAGFYAVGEHTKSVKAHIKVPGRWGAVLNLAPNTVVEIKSITLEVL